MVVGAMMVFRNHYFVLIEADEYTLNYMSNKKFPGSDVDAIVEKLKDKFREQSVLIRDTFRRFDEDKSGDLSMQEFKMALRKFNFDISDQELISIMRKFDPNSDGSIRYDEFCSSVIEDDYKQVESSSGGQVLHGHNAWQEAEQQAKDNKRTAVEREDQQSRLVSILEHAREVIGNEDCSDLFMSADERGDGHCGYEEFAKLLQDMGLGLSDEEMDLMMESFFDPDHPDQTRPMSIAVLDEALFR